MRNQSLSLDLFICVYAIRDLYSSLSLCFHASPSLGPAFVVRRGILVRVDLVLGSHPSIFDLLLADLGVNVKTFDRIVLILIPFSLDIVSEGGARGPNGKM